MSPLSSRPSDDPLRDPRGRPLHDLRISVTDRCNSRCPYCLPAESYGERVRAERERLERTVPARLAPPLLER